MSKKLRLSLFIAGSIVVLPVAFGLLFWNASANGDKFVRLTLPELTKNWDRVALRKALSQTSFSDADVERIAKLGAQHLGPIQQCVIRKGTYTYGNAPGRKGLCMAYGPVVQFKGHSMAMYAWVSNIDGKWQYVDFDFEDPAHPGNRLFKPIPDSVFPMGSPARHGTGKP
jgi:hypothetical protein